ncbi:MAG: hypothetical protein HYT87_17515 [Nitrospirae bacterium]|nr:hypothetical protein [Nitrospirota bacterium]
MAASRHPEPGGGPQARQAGHCWGAGHREQLGDGTNTARLTPVPLVGLP